MKKHFLLCGAIMGYIRMRGKYFLWLNTNSSCAIIKKRKPTSLNTPLSHPFFFLLVFLSLSVSIVPLFIIFESHIFYAPHILPGQQAWLLLVLSQREQSLVPSRPQFRVSTAGPMWRRGLTSFTHQENTPSAQCSFSPSSSRGVTQTHHETEPEV